MIGPLVSVIVPVHNCERYLAEALSSVEAQDYRPIEVIVVDDGSDDASAEVAATFASVRCVRQEHRGAAAARSAGLAVARGAFVAFADADDVLLPDKLSVQIGHLLRHPDVGCVLALHRSVVEPGTTPPPVDAQSLATGQGKVSFMSAVVRREAVDRVGGFDATYPVSEDMEWLGRLRSADVELVVLDRVVALRRLHSANLSHDGRALLGQRMRLLRERVHRSRSSGAAPPR